MGRPLSTRKRDLCYVVFLSGLIFLAFGIDFVPLYPTSVPSFVRILFDYYIVNYNDPLYAKDPPFFQLYVWIEMVFSVPTCLWGIRGLVKDDQTTPLYLLVLATHLVTSTLVCFVEVRGAENWPEEDIRKNLPGYVIFLLIALFLWGDMFLRIRGRLVGGKSKVN